MAEVDRPARRAGRPRTTVLTRDLIAHAALRLLDESGADGFTMARLAQALRVRPSALYNHVDGKEDVIAAVRELVSDRIARATPDDLDRIRACADALIESARNR